MLSLNILKKIWDRPQNQIPELDFLRTLAITLVLACHSATELRAYQPVSLDYWLFKIPFIRFGWSGVDLFFVLSGFLIGKQLWLEIKETGKISYFRFILRRGFRIWPLYFFILFVALLFSSKPLFEWRPELFFLTNYLSETVLWGSWSLSLEEQFYLLAPILILVFSNNPILILGLFAIAPLIRFWTSLDWSFVVQKIQRPLHTHYDGLLLGIGLAYLVVYKKKCPKAWLKWSLFITASGILLGLSNRIYFGYSGLALAYTFLIAVLTGILPALFKNKLLQSFFSAQPFFILARLSYGIYLIHPFILNPLAEKIVFFQAVRNFSWPPWVTYCLIFFGGTALSLSLASLGYVFIELPSLRFRDKFLNKNLGKINC